MKIVQSLPALSELGFCKHFAPWMIQAEYKDGKWHPWRTSSAEDFHIAPAAKVLHYAQEIFEGMKAFRRADGTITLFRPTENIRRMVRSAEILAMPPYPEADFMKAIQSLTAQCRDLVPENPGSLYLRPTMIATSSALGVSPAKDYTFFVLASPVGGYFGDTQSDKPASVSIMVTKEYVRAVRGGLGEAKTGANYAASLRAVDEAKKKGFENVLFLDAIERRNLEELSGMNIFVVEGGVLKTPKLGDTILRGVTRDSLLKLASLEKIPTEECDLSIDRVIEGLRSGKITEIFACGTGASVTSIGELGWEDTRIAVADKKPGVVSTRLYRALIDIQTGGRESPFPGWIVPVR